MRRIGTAQRTKWPCASSPAFWLRDAHDTAVVRVARAATKISPQWNVFNGDGRQLGVVVAAMQRYWGPDDIGASGSVFLDGSQVAHLRSGSFVDVTSGKKLAQLTLDSTDAPPWKNRANSGRWRLQVLDDVEERMKLMILAWLGVEFDLQWVDDHSPLARAHWGAGS